MSFQYRRFLSLFFLSLLLIPEGKACVGGKGFLPQNNWKIPVNYKARSEVDESKFNEVINKISSVYSPIIQGKGGSLVVERLWNDATVNAYALRQGNQWIVRMYGGLARHGEITSDGFALVMCHEVGHHIGGVPRYPGQNGWASNEGQSDYFAATKCLRRVWRNDNNEEVISRLGIPNDLKLKCESEWGNSSDQALCKRIGMAGLSTSRMFAVLSNGRMPAFISPDTNQVSQTLDGHPPYQCRLDTYFHGGLCPVSYEEEIGQSNPNVGTCNRASNSELGSRRLCWYSPTQTGPGNPPPTGEQASTPTVNGSKEVTSSNPNTPIPISIDVSRLPGTMAVALEASKPNTSFTNPADNKPDPRNSLGYIIINGTKGVYNLQPMSSLPSWGRYEFRVIGLDGRRMPVGKFSNPFILNLQK